MDQKKPALTLIRPPVTAEDMMRLIRNLTGRKPTPEEVERAREQCAAINARIAGRGDSDPEPTPPE